MLMLPELDTYGAIPAYARQLDDPVAAKAFTMLLIRCRRKLLWDLHDMLHAKSDVRTLMAYRLGMPLDALHGTAADGTSKQAPEHVVTDISTLTPEQQKDMYLSALKSVGMSVDPSVFMNSKDSSTGSAKNGPV